MWGNFFVLVETSSSNIFESFLFLCTHKCLSPDTSATPPPKKGHKSRNLVFYWSLQYTYLPLFSCIDRIVWPTPTTSLMAIGVWWLQQVLVDCSFQSRVVDQSYLVTFSLPDEILNSVNSFFFWLQAVIDNSSICTPISFAYSVTHFFLFIDLLFRFNNNLANNEYIIKKSGYYFIVWHNKIIKEYSFSFQFV